jgi:hypothetical protein
MLVTRPATSGDPGRATTLGAAAPALTRPAGRHWLFRHPLLDALGIACLFWPLLLLARPFDAAFDVINVFFYMLIVTPHRWITLILVFLDPDQREQRPRTYTGMFLGCVAVCLGAIALGRAFGIGLEAFYVLLVLDYLWNTWHFASQHHGVYRIYGRMSRRVPMPAERVERYALRAFVVYVLLRVGAATLFADKEFAHYMGWLGTLLGESWHLDLVALTVPAWLLVREFTSGPIVPSRALYLLSVVGVYSGLLLSALCFQGFDWPSARVPHAAFALAVTAFHSVEYMSIVTWSTMGKRAPRGAFATVVRKWPLVLAGTIVAVTLLQTVSLRLGEEVIRWWIAVNLSVSLLHYAYDGMIWKRPSHPNDRGRTSETTSAVRGSVR